ncbi:hypothetical protein HNP98_000880 [Hymenobacter sp. 9A]|uniref:Uncharacterized protein n=1 Tax=Hymenobacter caeli TaxID=2735894 RepID=A0ABX2FNM0_9BACT|nr:hypothetical protein [Hymenobacter caeli]NRT18069.1 hypothetical protein [Hymenobacter caeli]
MKRNLETWRAGSTGGEGGAGVLAFASRTVPAQQRITGSVSPGLKLFGPKQHVAEVAERGQRKGKQGNHHGSAGLDVVKKVHGFVKEPKAGNAGGDEEGEHQERGHGEGVSRKNRVTAVAAGCQSRAQVELPSFF